VSTVHQRRTQEQRREQMRERLLDATIASLIEDGYAATTLRAVSARADVSSGAMTHHFPRRVDLVGAAVERLAEQRIAALRSHIDAARGDRAQRVREVLDLLWGDLAGETFKVFVKLWSAADDDPELYERLVPLERTLARAIAAAVADFAAEFPYDDLDARMLVVLSALRGLALQRSFEPRRGRAADPWPRVRPLVERLLLEP
jgi:AcrR family transcriptional regulator